jgi:hypothetical protein
MFYLFRVEAVQIGDSPPALLLTPIVQPSFESKAIAATKKEKTERHFLRQVFWGRLLITANEITKLHTGVSANMHPYLATGAGTTGLSYQYSVTQHDCRVILWIDRGQGNAMLNEHIFDQLLADREAIEKDLGGQLVWERMDTARSCKAVAEVSGSPGWRADLDERENDFRSLADTMNRFEKALAPRIASLDLSMPAEAATPSAVDGA